MTKIPKRLVLKLLSNPPLEKTLMQEGGKITTSERFDKPASIVRAHRPVAPCLVNLQTPLWPALTPGVLEPSKRFLAFQHRGRSGEIRWAHGEARRRWWEVVTGGSTRDHRG